MKFYEKGGLKYDLCNEKLQPNNNTTGEKSKYVIHLYLFAKHFVDIPICVAALNTTIYLKNVSMRMREAN